MKNVIELINFLHSILEEKQPNRLKLVKEFQDEVWNDESIQDEKLNRILSELAYDLDFYEPNEEWRKEAPGLYNDNNLYEIIELAIQKLHFLT